MSGRMPHGWVVRPLGLLAELERGRFTARPRNDPRYYGGKYPFIQTGDVRKSGGNIDKYSQTLNEAGVKVSKLFPAGTLFITIAANIGELGVTKFASAAPDSLVAVRSTDAIDQAWLQYALSARKTALESIATQNAQANLNLAKLKPFPLLVPPRNEQAAIAALLGDADALATALEQMIAKRQAIKQAMMPQLLTGKARLPGFTNRWSETTLGDHVNYVKTVALSRAQLDCESPVRYLHYGDIHTRSTVRLDAANEPMPRAGSDLLHNAGRLQVGDLVLADASEDPDGVGKSVEITSVPDDGVVPGLHTIAARFDKAILADGFKAYLQFIPAFRQQLLRLAAGTKVLATTRGFISSVTLTLPDVDEQQAIATVLGDSDQESAVLHERLAKARDVKRGMMQELLTGRTRLPVEASTR